MLCQLAVMVRWVIFGIDIKMFNNRISYVNQLTSGSIPVAGYITPPQIATAYNIPAHNGQGIRVGIISLGGGFLQSDLDKSMTDMGLPSPTITQILLDGETGTFDSTDNASVENTLDIYCVASMVPMADIRIYISSNSFQGFNDAIFQAVADNCDAITISWGVDEAVGNGDFLKIALDAAA